MFDFEKSKALLKFHPILSWLPPPLYYSSTGLDFVALIVEAKDRNRQPATPYLSDYTHNPKASKLEVDR